VIHLHPGYNKYGKSPTRADVRIPEDWDVRIHKELPYIRRDEVMAKVCDILIGVSGSFQEVQRSGTWTTLRRGRTYKKRLKIILPSGVILPEGAF
jgi:hypothetical protein